MYVQLVCEALLIFCINLLSPFYIHVFCLCPAVSVICKYFFVFSQDKTEESTGSDDVKILQDDGMLLYIIIYRFLDLHHNLFLTLLLGSKA